jgi:hypothetical protein
MTAPRSPGGQRFLPSAPSQLPGSPIGSVQGFGGVPFSAPGVLPIGLAVPEPVPLSKQGDQGIRNLVGGNGYLPVKQLLDYFTRLPPRTLQQFQENYRTAGTASPGAVTTFVLGGFKVPSQMTCVFLELDFYSGRMQGGFEVANPPGTLGQTVTFSVLSNGNENNVHGFASGPPATGFFFGSLAPGQQPVQSPGTVLRADTGPGMASAPNQALYFEADTEVAFTVTTQPTIPYSIVGCSADVRGYILNTTALLEFLEVTR